MRQGARGLVQNVRRLRTRAPRTVGTETLEWAPQLQGRREPSDGQKCFLDLDTLEMETQGAGHDFVQVLFLCGFSHQSPLNIMLENSTGSQQSSQTVLSDCYLETRPTQVIFLEQCCRPKIEDVFPQNFHMKCLIQKWSYWVPNQKRCARHGPKQRLLVAFAKASFQHFKTADVMIGITSYGDRLHGLHGA